MGPYMILPKTSPPFSVHLDLAGRYCSGTISFANVLCHIFCLLDTIYSFVFYLLHHFISGFLGMSGRMSGEVSNPRVAVNVFFHISN